MTGIQLSIPHPCHENWQAMTPQQQGRFCASCAKTVVDFTTLTDDAILAALQRAGSNGCGRFTEDQLNRILLPSPQPARGRQPVWSLLLAGLLAGNSASAQEKSRSELPPLVPAGQVSAGRELMGDTVIRSSRCAATYESRITMGLVIGIEEKPAGPQVIRGMVADSAGRPIPFATLEIKDAPGIAADADGLFAFPAKRHRRYRVRVSAVGYFAQDYQLSGASASRITLYLDHAPEVLPAVEVRGTATLGKINLLNDCLEGRVGGYSISRATTPGNLWQKTWDSVFVRQNLRTFPNPVAAGERITWQANFKRPGRYRAELMDASGRIVWLQELRVNTEQGRGSIATETRWARGLYWLRIEGADKKRIYSAKVILQ